MRKILGCVSLLLAAVTLIHCAGNRDPKVIELKDRSVPLSEIVREYDRLSPANPWATASPEERKKFVETYARKELLVKTARDKCGPDLPAREALLMERWLDGREVERYWTKVQEAEKFSQHVRDSMDAVHAQQRLFSHVTCEREEDIRAIYARIQNGEDFAAVGKEFDRNSEEISFHENLWLERSEMPLEMGDVLFSMEKPGQISEPFPSARYGWHIIRYESERRQEPEAVDSTAVAMAEQRFRQAVQMRHEQQLRDKYGFEVVMENVKVIQGRFAPYWDSLTGGNPQQFTADFGKLHGPLHRFSEEELALPIVRMKGGGWTIRDYINSLSTTHIFFWPGTGTEARIAKRILRRMEQWGLRQEAAAAGIPTAPDFVQEKQRKRDELLLDWFFRENIQSHDYAIPREELETYWREHQEKYWSPNLVTYGFIWFPAAKKELARQAYDRLQKGERWEEVGADMVARDQRIVHEAMQGPTDSGTYPTVTREAQKFNVKADGSPFIPEPFEVRAGDWLLLKIFARQQPYMLDFAAAEEQVRRDVTGVHMEARVVELLEEYGKEQGLQINWKAIE
jgi:hypothetical protein